MKSLLFVSALFPVCAVAGFIHPMDFDGSAAQKKEVVEFIKAQVKHDYCEGNLDLCQNTTLRMMEQENLNAFKKASKATDRAVMDQVIRDYCGGGLDLCNYSTIYMMYQENVKAGNQELTW